MRCCVTGGAGFIASTLVDRLLAEGHHVTVFDNFSTGRARFLEKARAATAFRCINGDLHDIDALRRAMVGCDTVFHLAAHADVRHGPSHPRRDLEQNTIGTANVLAAALDAGVNGVAFASTGSVYGEPAIIPTPEDAPFPVQTSFYGASKLAAEGLLAAHAEAFGMRIWIFRLVSVLGPRYTHGHVYDFCRSLARDSTQLSVLGNGSQRKSYVHVDDCVAALLCGVTRAADKVNILNVGTDDSCDVRQSIGWICQRLGCEPRLEFTGGIRGWTGDNPHIHLATTRLRALGWQPIHTIRSSVEQTVDWLSANAWVF